MGRKGKRANNRKTDDQSLRLPNGRLKRDKRSKAILKSLEASKYEQAEKETMLPNLDARVKMHNLTPEQARDQRAGSYMGRLAMLGMKHGGISKKQEAAGIQWLEEKHAYMSTIAAPKSDAAFDPTRTPGRSHAENEAWAVRCKNKHRQARVAVQEAQNTLGLKSNLFAALHLIVEQDKELPHMIGDLREVLNVLGVHYGILHPRLRKLGDAA